MAAPTVQLFSFEANSAGGISDFELASEGAVSLCKAADGGCMLKVGSDSRCLALPHGCTIAACAGPYEHSRQWTLPASENRAFALVFVSLDEERHARQALVCAHSVLFDEADEQLEPTAASPAEAGLKARAKAAGGRMVDRALDNGKTAERIEAGGQRAAQGILAGAKWLGDGIQRAGDKAIERTAPATREHPTGPKTEAALGTVQRGAQLTLRASEAVRSTLFYGIKTVGRVTAAEVRKTAAYKRATEGDSERGALAADAGAAVVNACLSVLYASRRGTRVVVGDAKSTLVEVHTHKRGEAAGQAAKQALDSVDSLGQAVYNCCSLVTSPESLALEMSIEAADHSMSHTEWFAGKPLRSGLLRRRSALTFALGAPLLALLRAKSLALYAADGGTAAAGPQAPCALVPVDDMERVAAVGEADAQAAAGGAWAQWEVRTRDQVIHRFAAADVETRAAWVDLVASLIADADRRKGLNARRPDYAPGASGT